MLSSLYIAVSGMSAYTDQISVSSNNVSNMETTGYKASSVNFADMLAQSITRTAGDNTGCGVQVLSVYESWTQGSIATADIDTCLAINGWGMFVVSEPANSEVYYTRDGSFTFDKTGQLVNGDGLIVQGYEVADDGSLGGLTDIKVSYENFPPSPTTTMSTTINLDSGAEDGSTFESTVTVYDSLGNGIPITITYTNSTTANEWDYTAEIPADYGSVTGGVTGTLVFDSDGQLTAGTDPVFDLTLTNGAANQSITWDIFDDAGNTNGSMTQYSGDSILTDHDQDGYMAGELTSVEIDDSGRVVCTYSNGEIDCPYVIALADFTNYNGLEKINGNLYVATLDSGEAILSRPDIGRMGSISPGCLESSNTDLSTEMASLITAQMAYKACSRAFTVSDEILQVLVNMK